ncbi:MAG: STAS/SEC14 domain-containing protein [Patescibacteria group bacterium]
MSDKIIKTSISKVWLDDDGIGKAVFLPNAMITLEGVKEHIAACKKSSKGESVLVLFDGRNVKSVTRQARQYLSSDEVSKITKASAVLVSWPISRVIGNFFIGLNKPSYPTKLFTEIEAALKWLKSVEGKD